MLLETIRERPLLCQKKLGKKKNKVKKLSVKEFFD